MKRILIWTLGTLAILVLVVIVVGYMLPERHTASRDVVVAAPPDSVFALIATVENQPAWRTGVSRIEMLPAGDGGRTRYREHGPDGPIVFEVMERQPPRQLVTRIADPSLPFGGSWTYDLTAEATGTRLRITENGEVYNPVFRFVSRFIMGHTRTIDRYLADVQRHFAGASDVSPVTGAR
jgi:uncharacterized protein YndB with AHSA1/START domain